MTACGGFERDQQRATRKSQRASPPLQAETQRGIFDMAVRQPDAADRVRARVRRARILPRPGRGAKIAGDSAPFASDDKESRAVLFAALPE